MAIVEDEVRNDGESEEENEIEVVVEEDDVEQDSDDSEEEEDYEEVLEQKVADLEHRLTENPYNYDDHIELIQALWSLSALERWRAAFDRLQEISLLKPEHWLLRIQTEEKLAHSQESSDHIVHLFEQACLDCYSIPILSEWCTWMLNTDISAARTQFDEVLRRAGADPVSGKLFWDARLELEKSQLEALSEGDPSYKSQQERILWCLEEASSRPLLRSEEAMQGLREMAAELRDESYLQTVEKQHEVAAEYLQQITPYEDKLLTLENLEQKCKIYKEYIETVKGLSQNQKYAECGSDAVLKVLYDRATHECGSSAGVLSLLIEYARHTERSSSRATYCRTLDACTRRAPRVHNFWTLKMHQAEHENKSFDEVKSIFETALSKGMESYKQGESLWLSYLEYIRRQTDFDKDQEVERLRRTFRLAWDSLAEAWGAEANDCEVPLFWARLEYSRLRDYKQGKDVFEEIFKYGDNKTMSKYWEALVKLESSREPPLSENKVRDLYRRALRFVADYPPSIVGLWTNYERDYGHLDTLRECTDASHAKLKEWRENYQAMKDKMTGQKRSNQNKNKSDIDKDKNKGKRRANESSKSNDVKRKKEDAMEVETKDNTKDSGGGKKRSHEGGSGGGAQSKRQRSDSSEMAGGSASACRPGSRDACTLFVSNLNFKVDEQKVREHLSQYGEVVSLRFKAGTKAFGGSICYCQYKTPEGVENALRHDRAPLDGRPMFFSRYNSAKTSPMFKYATSAERHKLFVRNLPYSHCTKEALEEIFQKFGKLNDVRVVTFKDGKPKGLAYIEYADEAAAEAALQGTNGIEVAGRGLEVAYSAPPPRATPTTSTASLGQPKRDASGGMRRTQLSSLVPSVLQRPSTSRAGAAGASNGGPSRTEKRPLTNDDFRNMLLKK